MLTLIELQRAVDGLLAEARVNVICPISTNGRLSTTLGRAMFTRCAGKWLTVKIQLSADLVARGTEESVMAVLKHEVAHVIANIRTGYDCGHDSTFKAVCREIGCINDQTRTHVEYKTIEGGFKYEVICPSCGVVARYNRACKTVQCIEHYRCGNCGNSHLSIHQNF